MSKTTRKKKSYRRRKSGGKKQTLEQKILEYMLGLKEEVLKPGSTESNELVRKMKT